MAPGRWQEVTLTEQNDVVAAWPFTVSKSRLGRTHLGMPPLTMSLGPWMIPQEGKRPTVYRRQKQVVSELLDKLPEFDSLNQFLSPFTEYAVPFFWHGFELQSRFTNTLDNLSNLDAIWSGMESRTRRNITAAAKKLSVHRDVSWEQLYSAWLGTYETNRRTPPLSREAFAVMYEEARDRGQGSGFFALDDSGKVHAAIFLVWNTESSYFLLGGRDKSIAGNGAMSLLFWEAIQFSAGVSSRFDFEGSMVEPIERIFRSFGCRPTPYFQIYRESRRTRLTRTAAELFKALKSTP